MPNTKWNAEKVKELVNAIKVKDYATIDDLVDFEGDGALPDRAYGRGDIKYGPNSILGACIWTNDPAMFDHLLPLGMQTKTLSVRDGGIVGQEDAILFGRGGERDPEILRRLAHNGYDFASVWFSDIRGLSKFILNNRDDIELFCMLERSGLDYPKNEYYLSVPDEDCYTRSWGSYDSIPWEDLLCDECFELLDHFLKIGHSPERPLRLQVGAVAPSGYANGPRLISASTLEYVRKHDLPTHALILSEELNEDDKPVLSISIEGGFGFENPDALFGSLDYDLIKHALEAGVCEMKSEYVGGARDANRQDLLELYARYGVRADDMTSQLVEELETILLSAEHTDAYVEKEVANLSMKPKGELKTIGALRDGAFADWKTVAGLLARLYCAPFAYPRGQKSRRPSSLKKFVGKGKWLDVFEKCLELFDGDLDVKLLLPIPSISLDSYKNHPKGFGVGFWYEEDLPVFRLLKERGAEFLCKIKRSGGYLDWDVRNINRNRDAQPGDAFIWLSPEVSQFVFEMKGWSTDYLPVSYEPSYGSNRKNTHPLGWHLLDFLLLESGNAYAYKWFLDNAANVKEFKKPALRDVVNTPLLHTFLESKKDASIRSKDAVDLVVDTAKGSFCVETALLVRKLSLRPEAVGQLKQRLSDIKTRNKQAYIEEALAVLDGRSSEAAPTKKAVAKRPTVPQVVTMVANALDEGDGAKVVELEPIAAKVPMADCVELLERAAANCDEETIERLYGFFAPFECMSSALHVALFSGNVSTAKALVSHGADLSGKLLYINEKRTPKKGKATREKRYSHGLIGKRYSAGGVVAYNLREALTKDDGTIVSREKTTKKSPRSRKVVKAKVNVTSKEKAVDTLLSISSTDGFKRSIAEDLLWNLVCFDGRRTSDVCFDAANARKILESDILTKEEVMKLPWKDAIDSYYALGYAKYPGIKEVIGLVRDYAPAEDFMRCWRPSFAKRDAQTGEYRQLETMLLFIDELDAENCNNQLQVLTALAESDKLQELKRCASKPGWLTKQRIKKLIETASISNSTEMTAWLLTLSVHE